LYLYSPVTGRYLKSRADILH